MATCLVLCAEPGGGEAATSSPPFRVAAFRGWRLHRRRVHLFAPVRRAHGGEELTLAGDLLADHLGEVGGHVLAVGDLADVLGRLKAGVDRWLLLLLLQNLLLLRRLLLHELLLVEMGLDLQ